MPRGQGQPTCLRGKSPRSFAAHTKPVRILSNLFSPIVRREIQKRHGEPPLETPRRGAGDQGWVKSIVRDLKPTQGYKDILTPKGLGTGDQHASGLSGLVHLFQGWQMPHNVLCWMFRSNLPRTESHSTLSGLPTANGNSKSWLQIGKEGIYGTITSSRQL